MSASIVREHACTEAIEQVERFDPCVVVLDVMMPEMSGIEAAGLLGQTRPGQITILFSAYIDDRVITRARDADVTAWLSKDRIDELPEFIRQVVADAA